MREESGMKRIVKSVLIVGIIAVVFVLSAFKALTYDEMLNKFQPVFEIISYVQHSYYDIEKVDYDKVLDETLKGVMKGLDDPFA
jgi:carboxyl-terminal processing protease